MAKFTMNVTPDEFDQIKDARLNLGEADFIKFMQQWFGCQPFSEYDVVVIYDVPSIPWYSKGVHRFVEKKLSRPFERLG